MELSLKPCIVTPLQIKGGKRRCHVQSRDNWWIAAFAKLHRTYIEQHNLPHSLHSSFWLEESLVFFHQSVVKVMFYCINKTACSRDKMQCKCYEVWGSWKFLSHKVHVMRGQNCKLMMRDVIWILKVYILHTMNCAVVSLHTNWGESLRTLTLNNFASKSIAADTEATQMDFSTIIETTIQWPYQHHVQNVTCKTPYFDEQSAAKFSTGLHSRFWQPLLRKFSHHPWQVLCPDQPISRDKIQE